MTQLLAGDIGGTKTILRLVEVVTGSPVPTLLYEQEYPSGNYPDLVPMVQDFFTAAAAEIYGSVAPIKACFGIAGPVNNNTSALTNLSWSLEGDRLAKELNIAQVELINDFAAIGYGVLGLADEDLYPLQDSSPRAGAPIAVIGAGTGLGQCFLTPSTQTASETASAATYKVYATEGGHTDFAPRSELEFHLLQYLLDKYRQDGVDRISVERVVSGQGIVAIYQFLRDRQIAPESAKVGDVIREWERQADMDEKTVDPAATIAIAAATENDDLSQRTMQVFVEAYGAEAGNLALKTLPYGGLYIAGGIAAKNLDLMKAGSFMQAFTHKGRMTELLKNMPVRIVLNPKVGLIGAAVYAAQM